MKQGKHHAVACTATMGPTAKGLMSFCPIGVASPHPPSGARCCDETGMDPSSSTSGTVDIWKETTSKERQNGSGKTCLA